MFLATSTSPVFVCRLRSQSFWNVTHWNLLSATTGHFDEQQKRCGRFGNGDTRCVIGVQTHRWMDHEGRHSRVQRMLWRSRIPENCRNRGHSKRSWCQSYLRRWKSRADPTNHQLVIEIPAGHRKQRKNYHTNGICRLPHKLLWHFEQCEFWRTHFRRGVDPTKHLQGISLVDLLLVEENRNETGPEQKTRTWRVHREEQQPSVQRKTTRHRFHSELHVESLLRRNPKMRRHGHEAESPQHVLLVRIVEFGEAPAGVVPRRILQRRSPDHLNSRISFGAVQIFEEWRYCFDRRNCAARFYFELCVGSLWWTGGYL